MDRSDFVLVFQVQGYEFVRAVDTIYEVGTSLDHTLVDQFLKRFLFTNDPQVKQKFVPETTIDQVSGSMFGSSYIQVYVAPVFVYIFSNQSLVVAWIHVTQVISR